MDKAVDLNKKMKEILLHASVGQKLLLHSCCAVCAGGVLAREFLVGEQKKRLGDFFDITLYFYNPNLDSAKEHDRRAVELEKLRGRWGCSDVVVEPYAPTEFDAVSQGLANEREGGARCGRCFRLRLEQSARFAAANGFLIAGTTLSVSPHKNAIEVNKCGLATVQASGVAWLTADFKKENGVQASQQVANELSIYRQSYCGCSFSRRKNT